MLFTMVVLAAWSSHAIVHQPGAPAPLLHAPAETLGGTVMVESLLIPQGQTVWVESDLHLVASGVIRIEGQLVAFDADSLQAANAPSIALESPLLIDVPGLVLGGRGAQGSATVGGQGSSITLSAPLVLIDGLVQAGDGGAAGAARDGGKGGDALVLGYFNVRYEQKGKSTLRSGSGGRFLALKPILDAAA